MITFIRALHSVLDAAGWLAIVTLASIISYYGNPELGLGIVLAVAAMLLTLLVASVVVNRRLKLAARSVQNSEPASGLTRTYSAHASEAYDHDAQTVWSLIRPAESAMLLSDAQNAFSVPGTPAGVGEQQCFIGRDGSVSIIEIVGEESPWWATTRRIAPDETNNRSTYRIEPTPSGCILTVGTVIEIPANAEFGENPDKWWEAQMRPYLNRINQVLSTPAV